MKEQEEKRSRLLGWYEKFNWVTMGGALGFAFIAAAVAPELVVPALGLAAIDAGQIVVVDRVNKKKQAPKEKVVYQAGAA